jgi:hypothetical protein
MQYACGDINTIVPQAINYPIRNSIRVTLISHGFANCFHFKVFNYVVCCTQFLGKEAKQVSLKRNPKEKAANPLCRLLPRGELLLVEQPVLTLAHDLKVYIDKNYPPKTS